MIVKSKSERITQPQDVARILTAILKSEAEHDQDKEHFWTIGLNTKNIIKYIDLVSLGTLDSALVHPRETFRLAVMKGINSIIVAHNHPSGIVEPSSFDIAITKRLVEAGKTLGIEVLDSVIINLDGDYKSIVLEGEPKDPPEKEGGELGNVSV